MRCSYALILSVVLYVLISVGVAVFDMSLFFCSGRSLLGDWPLCVFLFHVLPLLHTSPFCSIPGRSLNFIVQLLVHYPSTSLRLLLITASVASAQRICAEARARSVSVEIQSSGFLFAAVS
jgi:hypothetical protein